MLKIFALIRDLLMLLCDFKTLFIAVLGTFDFLAQLALQASKLFLGLLEPARVVHLGTIRQC